jgi:pyruvate,water dikinase
MTGYWFREDLHLPRPLSPLTATATLPGVVEGQQAGFRLYGGPAHVRARVEQGYLYFGAEDHGAARPPTPEQMARAQAAFADLPRRWAQEVLPEVQRAHAELRALAPPGSDARRAAREARRVADIYARVYALHFELCFPMMGAILGFEQLLQQAGVPEPGKAVVHLCEGAPNKIGELDDAMLELGALAEAEPALAALVEAQDAEGLAQALQAHGGAAGQRFRALWPQLAERPSSMDVFDPTWGEDPAPLLRGMAGGSAAWKQRQAARAETLARGEALERDVRARIPEAWRGPFEGMLRGLRASWPLMQTHHYWMDELATGLARLALLRCAEPLVGRGLATREEAVFLRLDELTGALEGAALPPGLVEERRRERDAQTRATPPKELGTMPPQLRHDPMLQRFFGLRPGQEEGGALRGMAASPGRRRGRARVVREEAELDALEPGEVLVAVTTEPAWTAAMARASALVAETGGILCHTAIVARECNLPGVVGARGATQRIRTGDLVEVDGDAGTVTIVG